MARWSTCSRLRESDGIYALLLLHRALQRMLMPPGKFNDLGNLGFGYLVCEDAANPDPVAVNVQHDLNRLLTRLVEETLQNVNDKLHRGVVVVQQQHLVEAGPLRFGPRLRGHTGRRATCPGRTPTLIVIAHG